MLRSAECGLKDMTFYSAPILNVEAIWDL